MSRIQGKELQSAWQGRATPGLLPAIQKPDEDVKEPDTYQETPEEQDEGCWEVHLVLLALANSKALHSSFLVRIYVDDGYRCFGSLFQGKLS